MNTGETVSRVFDTIKPESLTKREYVRLIFGAAGDLRDADAQAVEDTGKEATRLQVLLEGYLRLTGRA